MENQLKHILNLDNNVRFAYLFGSYAKGDFTDKSDVDIAVYLYDDNLDAKLTLHHKLETYLQKNVDIVYLNDVKNIYLLESIITEGILIKDDEERAMFEVKKQHEIIDFKNFKKYIDAA